MRYAFLTYVNRSGSTLLSEMLSKNPDILVFPEANLLHDLLLKDPHDMVSPETLEQLSKLINSDIKLINWGLEKAQEPETHFRNRSGLEIFKMILDEYAVQQKKKGVLYGLFKNNSLFDFYHSLGNEAKQDMGARFISLVRDPRAVFASQKAAYDKKFQLLSANPLITAHAWNWFVDQSAHAREEEDFIEIRYEAVVSNPESAIAAIYNHLELEGEELYLERQGNLFDRIPPEHRKLHHNIKNAPDSSRVKAWQKSLKAREIWLIESMCGARMKDLGYDLQGAGSNMLYRLWRLYLKIRIFLKIDSY
jgi:hypothetical protein